MKHHVRYRCGHEEDVVLVADWEQNYPDCRRKEINAKTGTVVAWVPKA